MQRGFIAGLLLGFATIVIVAILQAGPPNFCGNGQDGPICLQQWLTALGPAIALLFAGYGAVGLRNQILQGQSAVIANQRQQLREEHEVLSDLREELAEQQRKLEDFEKIYTLRVSLPTGTTWSNLEELQYKFDGLVEWLADAAREPYLFTRREQLGQFRKRAYRRSEWYRYLADLWQAKRITDHQMAMSLGRIRVMSIRDMERFRDLLDRTVIEIAERFSLLSKTRKAPGSAQRS